MVVSESAARRFSYSYSTPPESSGGKARTPSIKNAKGAPGSGGSTCSTLASISQWGISPGTLRAWLRQAEVDEGLRDGLTSAERAELLRVRREVRILEDVVGLPEAVLAR